MPMVDVVLRPPLEVRGIPLDRRIANLEIGVEVTSNPCFAPRFHYSDVLLRHRLPLQARSFEGLGPTRKRTNLTKRSVAEARNHEPESLTDLGLRVLDTSRHVD